MSYQKPQASEFSTSDFKEAIFLRISGVIHLRTEFDGPRAVFVFKAPADDIKAAWASGDDKNVRIVLNAADFFREEIFKRRRD